MAGKHITKDLFEIGMTLIIKAIDNIYEEIISNENRKKILAIINEEDRAYNITEISKKINVSYKNTFMHIKKLERYGFLETKKLQNKKGQSVIIIPLNKSKQELLYEILAKDVKDKEIQNKLPLIQLLKYLTPAKYTCSWSPLIFLTIELNEPRRGIEPPTDGLQNHCSTIELPRPK